MAADEKRGLSDDEVLAVVASAFQPLRCIAKVWDYGKKVKFRIFNDRDEPIMKMEELNLELSRNESYLIGVLEPIRERLEGNGFKLGPWQIKRIM